jgi:hypothetical protein
MENPEWRQESSVRAKCGFSSPFVAIESAFQHDGMPVGVPHGEGAECLVAADHGSADRSARRLAEIGSQDVEDEPADVGEQIAIVSEE